MAETQEENKADVGKVEAAAKAQDRAKERSKKFVSNLVTVTIVVTVLAVGLIYLGMGFVFAFLAIGLLPAIVAAILDNSKGRLVGKTVFAFNLAGMAPHLISILLSGMPNQASLSVLQNPTSWLMVYGFAAFGWGVVYTIPQMVLLYLEIKASYLVKKYEHFQKELVDEWGDGIKK